MNDEIVDIARAFLLLVGTLGVVALWFEITSWLTRR